MYSLLFLKCKTKKQSKIPLIVKHHLALIMPFSLSEALCATCASEMVQMLATTLSYSAVGVEYVFEDT